jgi:hypothetical protein
MKKTTGFKVASLLTLAGFAFNQAYAASTTGNATQTVQAAISITNTADLAFGTAAAGDVAKSVAPAAAESGRFTVNGAPNTAYTITLPSAAVNMITGGGGANETIAVTAFTSNPAATGLLNGAGTQTLAVGATRAALGAAQVAGAYTAAYTVTVVY